MAASRECCRRFSCGSKSETVVPRARLPLARIAPACSSRVSTSRSCPRRPVRPARYYGCPESCTPWRAPRQGGPAPHRASGRQKPTPHRAPAATRTRIPGAYHVRHRRTHRPEEERRMNGRDAARRRDEEKVQRQLDEALAASFPASDPVSIVTSQTRKTGAASRRPAQPAPGEAEDRTSGRRELQRRAGLVHGGQHDRAAPHALHVVQHLAAALQVQTAAVDARCRASAPACRRCARAWPTRWARRSCTSGAAAPRAAPSGRAPAP